jgi:mRNA interferase MazF
MTNYQSGDLLLVDFPFTATGPGKPRPALVLLDAGDADVLLARVTTQSYGSPYDVSISAWQQAGLLAPSIVGLHKLATLAKNRVHKHLGSLEAADRQAVAGVLQRIAAAW